MTPSAGGPVPPDAPQASSDVGSLSEEAGRLAEDLWRRWTSRAPGGSPADASPTGDRQGDRTDDPGSPGGAGPSPADAPDSGGSGPGQGERAGAAHLGTCSVCPLCRTVDQLRETRPEVLEQVAGLALALGGLLRDLARSGPSADGRRPASSSHRPPDPPDESRIEAEDPFGRGTRIDVVDDESDTTGGAHP